MSNIFIINAGLKTHVFNPEGKAGSLNKALVDIAEKVLTECGDQVCITDLNNEWVLENELQRIKAADTIILQSPIWAMGVPWPMKRYIDIVMTDPAVCGTDGRTRSDPTKKYDSGGFLTDKHYMLNTTWNAPWQALTEPEQFFDARGLEDVLLPLHKQFQYMGVQPLPSFSIHDVYKNPTIEADLERWKEHLKRYIA